MFSRFPCIVYIVLCFYIFMFLCCFSRFLGSFFRFVCHYLCAITIIRHNSIQTNSIQFQKLHLTNWLKNCLMLSCYVPSLWSIDVHFWLNVLIPTFDTKKKESFVWLLINCHMKYLCDTIYPKELLNIFSILFSL